MRRRFATAAQLAPKFANYWFERGYALEQQARKKTVNWEEAKEPFQKCIEADPNFADCYEELGNVFLWTDDEQKALENYNKAVEHDPSNIGYYTMLAGLYLDLGFAKEAEQALKEAKGFVKPDDKAQVKAVYNLHVLLARVYQERGSHAEESVPELEAAKAVAPNEGPEVDPDPVEPRQHLRQHEAPQVRRGDLDAEGLQHPRLQGRQGGDVQDRVRAGAGAGEQARRHAAVRSVAG